MQKKFVFAAFAAMMLMTSCGDIDWLRIKRPKFETPADDKSKNDTIYEDVDFSDPYVPDEYCTAPEPDDIPEEVIAVEEEE